MTQVEGSNGINLEDTLVFPDCDDPQYIEWLKTNQLTKFYIPLKDCLGIDSIEACKDVDTADIPRICQNIPNNIKQEHNITFKDEVTLKKQLKLLIRQRDTESPRQQKQEAPQSKQKQKMLRKLTDAETSYFSQLQQKQKECDTLLKDTLVMEVKENEQQYEQLSNQLRDTFNQFETRMKQIYQVNYKMFKNEYESNCISKMNECRQDLNQVSKEMKEIESKFMKSIEYNNTNDYVIQSRNLNEISQSNVKKMKSVVDKYETIKRKGDEIKKSNQQWNRMKYFLENVKLEMNRLQDELTFDLKKQIKRNNRPVTEDSGDSDSEICDSRQKTFTASRKARKDIEWKRGDVAQISEDNDGEYRDCIIYEIEYDEPEQDYILSIEYLDDRSTTTVALKEIGIRSLLNGQNIEICSHESVKTQTVQSQNYNSKQAYGISDLVNTSTRVTQLSTSAFNSQISRSQNRNNTRNNDERSKNMPKPPPCTDEEYSDDHDYDIDGLDENGFVGDTFQDKDKDQDQAVSPKNMRDHSSLKPRDKLIASAEEQSNDFKKNDDKKTGVYWNRKYVGSTNQFQQQSTGSSMINGLEAAIQLQLRKEPSIELVDKIVKIAGVYKGDTHTGMDDIFPKISRYNLNLDKIEYVQLLKSASNVLFDTMRKLIGKYGNEISCVVTAPPESFFLHMRLDGSLVMFDSHPRPHVGLKNGHFLIFGNSKLCEKYLKTELLKSVKLDINDISQYQLQAMNAFEAYLFCLKRGATPDPTPNMEQLERELNSIDFRLSVQFGPEKRNLGNDYSDLQEAVNVSNNSNASKEAGVVDILRERLKSEREDWKHRETRHKNEIEQLKRHVSHLRKKENQLTSSSNRNEHKDDEKLNNSQLNNQFFCRLCTTGNGWKPNHARVVLTNCGCNNLCRECAFNYIKHQIGKNVIEIKCPTCKAENNNINEKDIEILDLDGTLVPSYRALVNAVLTHLVKKEHNNSFLQNMQCPNGNCNFNAPSHQWIKYKMAYLICPQCEETRWCKNCRLSFEFHEGWVSCDVAKLRQKNPKQFMQCPNCGVWKENESYGGM